MVSFAPTATLSVIAKNITIEMPIPVLDNSQFGWTSDIPTQIALRSASLADVVPLNISFKSQAWSYDMQLFGPTVKCRAANSSEQASFDQLTDQLQRNRSVYIAEHINGPSSHNLETRSLILLYSAFQPANLNSNWSANTSKIFSDVWEGEDFLFFQTSTSSFICALMETSINITIASFHGQQQVIQNSIQYLSTIRLYSGTSQALRIRRPLDLDDWRIDNNETENMEFFESLFPKDPWQCRNRTLMRAVEDLSINTTIGYLSSPNLTNNHTEFRNITTSDTRNIYIYHPLYLILSYGIGFLLASLAALTGLYSIYTNGVSHSNSFSAIMLTTRNADLDILARGKSLASDPLPENIKNTRLRFGLLISKQGFEKMGHDDSPRNIAFGFEGSVGELKKGGKYV
ncbi:hypothetical protein BOTCAL_0276g00150 [Botryotinia calthae]|uniref:Uncharacterized protein n=1 Tax=Botryotinia calthae TaxID=38488 RepID=A0A4Y8CVL1_9HELO|nr:hypothetical protein BOTCAL_0276g00150 [Botryotinia calthae]